MAERRPVLDQLNLVVRDMDRAIAFYRLLGVDIADGDVWRTGTGAHHVVMRMPDGFELALDSRPLARTYNAAWRSAESGSENPAPPAPGPTVMSFRFPGAAAVDETYGRLLAAGHAGAQAPYYTFWGSRYAIVVDPDGNHVGLMGPPEREHRSGPPDI